jgi:uncharacterized membrane protein
MKAWIAGFLLMTALVATPTVALEAMPSTGLADSGFAFASEAMSGDEQVLGAEAEAATRGGGFWLPFIFGTIGIDLALFGAVYGIYIPYYGDSIAIP